MVMYKCTYARRGGVSNYKYLLTHYCLAFLSNQWTSLQQSERRDIHFKVLLLLNNFIKINIIQNQKSRTQWHQQHQSHSSHANICLGSASLFVSTDQLPAPTPGFGHIDQRHLSNRKTIRYNFSSQSITIL